MHKSGWEAPTYPSFDFRQSAEKSLVLSLKLASARTLRARRSGTGPGRWVDLASLKASRPRMYALGRAGRPRSRHFTAKRWPKTKLALHTVPGTGYRYHPLWQNEAVGNTGARARAIVARTVNLRGFPPAVFRRNRGWGKGVGKDCSRYIRDRVKFELKSSQIQMRSRIRLLWGARRRERSGGRGATGMAGS